jgi:hypothetical protein
MVIGHTTPNQPREGVARKPVGEAFRQADSGVQLRLESGDL